MQVSLRLVKRRCCCAALPLLLFAWSGLAAADPSRIDHSEKIGIGTWPVGSGEQMLSDVEDLGAGWFYTWQPASTTGSPTFVPMIWGAADAERLHEHDLDDATILLTFNEPDLTDQANLPVEEVLRFWPGLMDTGARLGSPATTKPGTLGSGSWLARFMAEAEKRSYRIDFVAVHYYSDQADVCRFRDFLIAVHQAYDRPVWVTEWALADWQNPGRFNANEQSAFLASAAHMMDDLPFVERHAWFGAYEGLGNVYQNSGLLSDAGPTAVGRAFRSLTRGDSESRETVSGEMGCGIGAPASRKAN